MDNRAQRVALNNMGFSVFYTPNLERAIQLYHIFNDLVKVVITDVGQSHVCWWTHPSCRRKPDNPSGIPVWKMLTFYFWSDINNPLGEKWTLSPEPVCIFCASFSIFSSTYPVV